MVAQVEQQAELVVSLNLWEHKLTPEITAKALEGVVWGIGLSQRGHACSADECHVEMEGNVGRGNLEQYAYWCGRLAAAHMMEKMR